MSNLLRQLSLFRSEVDKAVMSYSAWRTFHDQTVSAKSLKVNLNRNAAYWNIIQYSLQMSYYMALGRIFDCNGKSISIFKLIKACKSNINEFSKESLALRKGDVWSVEYAKNVTVPESADFEKIRLKVKDFKILFDEKIQPVRHKVYAHLNDDSVDELQSLYSKISVGEFEKVLYFLQQLHEYVWQLYHNGRLIPLEEGSFENNKRITADFKLIAEKIVKA